MRPDGKTYRLRCIADIWALPDADVMERAFDALAHRMLQARRYEEHMRRSGRAVVEASTFTAFDWVDEVATEPTRREDNEDRTLAMFNTTVTEQRNVD